MQDKKIETVRKHLGAMKIKKTEKGYYVRYRKSKNNKIMLDDIFKFEDVMEEDWGAKRIGDYEFTMTEKGFEYIYNDYMSKLYARER